MIRGACEQPAAVRCLSVGAGLAMQHWVGFSSWLRCRVAGHTDGAGHTKQVWATHESVLYPFVLTLISPLSSITHSAC